jgi:cell division protein FtsL
MISLKPQNVIRHIPWRLDSRAALGFVLILITFSLVGWLYLTQASAVTTTSYRIDEMRLELDHLKNQNASLILEIAELEALSRVEARARELGFEPTTEVQYVSVPNYPVPVEETLSSYHSTRADVSVDAYVADIEEPSWWVERLDALAAWLEEDAGFN